MTLDEILREGEDMNREEDGRVLMRSLGLIEIKLNMEQISELDYDLETKPRRKVLEPQNKYEFCQAFSKITNRPLGLFLKETKGWPLDWFFSIQSECKEKTREKQAIYINWFLKSARPK